MTSLRSRLFQAIALIVALCIGLTLALGLLFTRRAVDHATLQDLEHQAALIAERERVAVAPFTYLRALRPYLRNQHEIYHESAAGLPESAEKLLTQKHPQPAAGSTTINGTSFFFAAQPVEGRSLVLLRHKSVTTSEWLPYVGALLVAAFAGVLLAAAAAIVLARRITRPVQRVAVAARTLARGSHPEPLPVEGASEIATLAVAFNDLTKQLARAREAEKSFLLSVSHELKTPLTAIHGWAEALAEDAVDVHEAAETVAAESARLERLVRDLLDLARMNRTDFSVHPTNVDLAEVAADAVRRYQQQAASFGVELAAVSEGPAPAVADADRALQVVSNLVENALRLTPRGGEVRVVTAPGVLRVEDTGPGLNPDDRTRAFERFYLHERYGRERPVGTGLGLAIVKELTEAMGGRVDVMSEPGRLTTFTVRLPAAVSGKVLV
jgi:signal transduction histidine kinase